MTDQEVGGRKQHGLFLLQLLAWPYSYLTSPRHPEVSVYVILNSVLMTTSKNNHIL